MQCKTLHHFALNSTRNRFCWQSRVASVSRTEICFVWRNIQWHLKKRLEGAGVNSTYNSLCCIPLKLSLLVLKKTIRSKKDFDSAYNWMFWMYSIRDNERVTKSFYIISSVLHAFWLVLTYDLLENRRIDDVIIKTCFNSLLYKTNRFQVAVRLFSNKSTTYRQILHFSQWKGFLSIPIKCLHFGQKYSDNFTPQRLQVWLSSFIWIRLEYHQSEGVTLKSDF